MQKIRLLNITLLSILLTISHAGWTSDVVTHRQTSGSPLQELPEELQVKICDHVAHDGPVAWTRLMATNQRNYALVKGEEERYIQSEMKHLDENERKLQEAKRELIFSSAFFSLNFLRQIEFLSQNQQCLHFLKKIDDLEQARSPDFPSPSNLRDHESHYINNPLFLAKQRVIQSQKKEIQKFNQQIEQILQEAELLLQQNQSFREGFLFSSVQRLLEILEKIPEIINQNNIILEELDSNPEQHQAMIKFVPSGEIYSKYKLKIDQSKNWHEGIQSLEKIMEKIISPFTSPSLPFFTTLTPFEEIKSLLTTEKGKIQQELNLIDQGKESIQSLYP